MRHCVHTIKVEIISKNIKARSSQLQFNATLMCEAEVVTYCIFCKLWVENNVLTSLNVIFPSGRSLS